MSQVPPPTAAILTLGCKLNLADSEAMARRMRDGGWRVAEAAGGADAVIVNTCSVTRAADRKSRHLVRLVRRQAPGASIAVTGCLLETVAPDVVEALEADLVFRQADQTGLTQRLLELRPAVTGPSPASRAFRTRAFVSAQEGCNDVCAFCIVPRTRGRERSKAIATVVAEVQAREADGIQEVVITGTQLGAYGRDRAEKPALPELLQALLAETKVPRIRMSSVQPQDISPRLLELWRDRRLCRHFHLALQSGSESVLRRMRRRYTADEYRIAVERLRTAVPDVAITTDVIAAFPGETQAEFEETLTFCEEMRFAGMHVFPYSQRPGTAAAKMPSSVEEESKKRRVRALIDLGEGMAAAYRHRFLGKAVPVLWETSAETPGGPVWDGLTDTYVRVRAATPKNIANQILTARLTAVEGDFAVAELVHAAEAR